MLPIFPDSQAIISLAGLSVLKTLDIIHPSNVTKGSLLFVNCQNEIYILTSSTTKLFNPYTFAKKATKYISAKRKATKYISA